jgi:hypothetical protein
MMPSPDLFEDLHFDEQGTAKISTSPHSRKVIG